MLLGFGLALIAPVASAEPVPEVRLDYRRSEEAVACPDEQALRRNVAERLGYDPFSDKAARTLKTRIDRVGGELTAELVLLAPDGSIQGRRTLHSSGTDCAELASSVALAVAIAVDPLVVTRPPPPPEPTPPPAPPGNDPSDEGWVPFQPAPPPPPPAPAPEPPPSHANGAPRAEPPAAPADPRWVQMSLVGMGAIGTAPAVTPGISVQVGSRSKDGFFGIEGRADVPASAKAGRGSVSTGQLVGGAVVCAHHLWLGACGVVNAGVLRSEGIDLLNARSASSFWLTVGGRTMIDIPVSKAFQLRFQSELTAQPTRTSLMVGPVSVWKSPTVSFTIGAGLAWSPWR